MGRVIFVEVLDRRGRVRDRIRLDRFPARVGRAYSNDVIIEDRYVSPEHFVISTTEEGELVAEDCGSLNGLKVVGERATVARARLSSGIRIKLGETVLRIVEPGHLVAPAEPILRDPSWLFRLRKSPVLSAFIGLATFAIFLTDVYLESYFDTDFVEMAGPTLLGLSAVALWAGIWAFVNRLLTHRFEFSRHFSISCFAAVASVVLIPVGEYGDFIFSSEALGSTIDYLSSAVVFTLLLAGHLRIIPVSTRRRRRVWATVAATVVVGLTILIERASREEFTTEIQITVPLKAYGVSLTPAESLDEFLVSSRSVKTWVDARAESDGR